MRAVPKYAANNTGRAATAVPCGGPQTATGNNNNAYSHSTL